MEQALRSCARGSRCWKRPPTLPASNTRRRRSTSAANATCGPARRFPTARSTSCAASTRSSSAPSATRTSTPGILEKGILLQLRFELDQYINLRPVKLYPNVDCPLKDKGPEDIDFVVVRENTEGLYAGTGGFQNKGTPHEVSTQIHVKTRFGVERASATRST